MTVDKILVESCHVFHINWHRNYYLHTISEFSMPLEWSTGKVDDTEIQLIACKCCAKVKYLVSVQARMKQYRHRASSVGIGTCQHEQTGGTCSSSIHRLRREQSRGRGQEFD